MDISLAPFPKQYGIGDILEKFGIESIGSHGTTYITSILTDLLRDIIDKSEIKAKEKYILSITENGFGKKTSHKEYRVTNRGGKGIIGITRSSIY